VPPSAFGFKHVFVVPSLGFYLRIEGYLILVSFLDFMALRDDDKSIEIKLRIIPLNRLLTPKIP